MRHHVTGLALAISGGLALATPAQASLNDQFVCDAVGDGHFVVMIMAMDGQSATVRYELSGEYADQAQAEPPQRMTKVPSASGEKYAGAGYVFHAKGTDGTLTYDLNSNGGKTANCRFAGDPGEQEDGAGEASVDAAGSPHDPIAVPGQSWGGKLRSGPGMDYEQVGSLYEGNSVTLLLNTGVAMNGYDWFRIRTADGREAYQWGGLLCPLTQDVAGTFGYGECPADAEKKKATGAVRIRIEGFECGDNCYLNYRVLKATGGAPSGEEQSALCSVDACEAWYMEQEMPSAFVGRTASATIGTGKQYDNAGTVMSDDFAEIRSLVIDTAN